MRPVFPYERRSSNKRRRHFELEFPGRRDFTADLRQRVQVRRDFSSLRVACVPYKSFSFYPTESQIKANVSVSANVRAHNNTIIFFATFSATVEFPIPNLFPLILLSTLILARDIGLDSIWTNFYINEPIIIIQLFFSFSPLVRFYSAKL